MLDDDLGLTGDEATGVRIVAQGRRRAAALDRRERWRRRLRRRRQGPRGAASATGYNAATGEYGDLVAQGVLDPVKVTRSALVNAASIAGMLLTTETLVVEKPEDEDARRRPVTATVTATDPPRPRRL